MSRGTCTQGHPLGRAEVAALSPYRLQELEQRVRDAIRRGSLTGPDWRATLAHAVDELGARRGR